MLVEYEVVYVRKLLTLQFSKGNRFLCMQFNSQNPSNKQIDAVRCLEAWIHLRKVLVQDVAYLKKLSEENGETVPVGDPLLNHPIFQRPELKEVMERVWQLEQGGLKEPNSPDEDK